MDCSMPDFPSLHYLPESAQIHAHWVNDAIQPSHPLSSPSVFHSIRVLSNEPALCIRWTKYWSFRFGISLSDEYTGLISFRIDWCDPLAVQGTLKSFHQHYHSKASILWWSAFFMVQLSHPYTTTGKTIDWTIQTLAKCCLCFLIHCLECHSFSSKEQVSFNFMATVTVHSDFGTQENKVCY